MKTLKVSVSSLKARLSEYLRVVGKGGRIVILDHNHPVAIVSPIIEENSSSAISIEPPEDSSLKGFFGDISHSRKEPFSLDILLGDRKKR
jgi:prevent-host-death family protein